MLDDYKNNFEKVKFILENEKDTRDSDQLLYLEYLKKFCGLCAHIGFSGYEKLKEVMTDKNTASYESLSRLRRRLQESGEFVGTKRKCRLEESEKVKNHFKK